MLSSGERFFAALRMTVGEKRNLDAKCFHQKRSFLAETGKIVLSRRSNKKVRNMVHWGHRDLLGTLVFTIACDVVRDVEEEYEAWSCLDRGGWGLVASEPTD